MSIDCPYRDGPRNPVQKPADWKAVTVGPCTVCGKRRLRSEKGVCLSCANKQAGLPGQEVSKRRPRRRG